MTHRGRAMWERVFCIACGGLLLAYSLLFFSPSGVSPLLALSFSSFVSSIAGADLSPNDYLRYNSRFENTTVVMEEVLSNQAGPAATAGSGSGSGSNAGSSGASSNDNSSASPALKAKFVMARKTSGQTPPSTAHTSEILDMKALEFPQKMIATAARDGVIKIWI